MSMHEEREVVLPVVYETRRGRKEAWLGTTEAVLRIVPGAEAPVVVEGFSTDWRGARESIGFRAYGGRLWEPLRDPAARGMRAYLERLQPKSTRGRPEAWRDLLDASPADRHLVLNHPLLSSKARDVGSRYGNFVDFERKERNRDYLQAAEEVRQAAARVIVVGDEVLKPSWGPLLGLDWYGEGKATRLTALAEHERSSLGVQIAVSMLDADRVIEWLDAEELRPTLDGLMPTVLSDEGWDHRAVVDGCLTREVDREAWSLMTMVHGFRPNGRHRALLEAVVDLRESMEWAREGRELQNYEANRDWLEGKLRTDAAAAGRMVEPFRRCIEEYKRIMPSVRSIQGWHTVLDLAERQTGIELDVGAFDRAMRGLDWN